MPQLSKILFVEKMPHDFFCHVYFFWRDCTIPGREVKDLQKDIRVLDEALTRILRQKITRRELQTDLIQFYQLF